MLKELIKEDAVLICGLLSEKESLTVSDLQQLTDYQEMYLFMVIGWLSKENKITCTNNDDLLTFSLNL